MSVVLVVDPVAQTAERVSQALAGTRLRVRVARDVPEAEQIAREDDVVALVAALNLPRGSAYELGRNLRVQHPAAAVLLVCGGFDVYNAERAADLDARRLTRPVTVEAVRRQLEAALGPFAAEEEVLDATASLEPLEPVEPAAPLTPLPAPPPVAPFPTPATGDERVATFLPRDWRGAPPVQVDPEVVGPALERAILAVLPEVVEAVLNKAIVTSPAFRELVEVAVEDTLREELPAIARRVIRERLAEVERKDPTD